MRTALFTVFFLYRRLLTALILVSFWKWPYFQCSFMMIMSTTNLMFLVVDRPLRSRLANKVDVFNEACILTVFHSMTMCLNIAIKPEANDFLGWVMIITTSVNILLNLALATFQSLP